MSDYETLKEEIRQRVELVDVVSEQVALKRTGRDFVGLCPFHQEKTPSFSVSPSKQIFKCFGCGAGGDVFSFVQLRESVEFVEAMRILADRAGIDFDRRVGRAPAEGLGRADIARANAWAGEAFQQAFADEAVGRIAREYAVKRGISPEMIEAFGLGWAPEDGSFLMQRGSGAGMNAELLMASGVVARGSHGDVYSVFRGRLMFPIRDSMNRVIGFGGRTLIGDRAKYLNTSQNALFDKGRNLYGIDRARQAITESRVAVVVEGYTDCIAAHQHGVTNVVATLGTALTDEQVTLLRRWCDEVILVFDSDTAGQNAADRALRVALRHDLVVRIARLTSGKDPADFLAEQGAEAFREVLNSAVEALGFKWQRTREKFATGEAGGRKEAIREFIQLVAGMVRFRSLDAIQQGLMVNQIGQLLALPGRDVHQLLTDAARDEASRESHARRADLGSANDVAPVARRERGASAAPRDAEQAALTTVLEVILNEPGYYDRVRDVFIPERLADAAIRRVAEEVVRLCESFGEFALGELLAKFDEVDDVRLITSLIYRGEAVGNFDATVADAAERLRRLQLRQSSADVGAKRRAALEAGDGEARALEDEWLRKVQDAAKQAQDYAPGIPTSVSVVPAAQSNAEPSPAVASPAGQSEQN